MAAFAGVAVILLLIGCGNKTTATPTVTPSDVTPSESATKAPEDPTPTVTVTPTEGIALSEKYITKHSRVSVHDPSVEYDNGKYYIFGSHLAAAVSEDLASWSYIKSSNKGYSKSNKLFNTYDKVFAEPGKYVGGTDQLWAPDVIFNKAMGKYCM